MRVAVEAASHAEYITGRGACLSLNGRPWGWIGELSREVLDKSDLQDAVTVAELRLPLIEELFEPSRTYSPVPRFPSIIRDLNFVLPESVTWAELSDAVAQAAGSLLLGTTFGGQYRGKQIDADRKIGAGDIRFVRHA